MEFYRLRFVQERMGLLKYLYVTRAAPGVDVQIEGVFQSVILEPYCADMVGST